MSWIEKIRQKPREERMRLMWVILAIVLVILIAVWALVGTYTPDTNSGSNPFFKSLRDAANNSKNLKISKPQ